MYSPGKRYKRTWIRRDIELINGRKYVVEIYRKPSEVFFYGYAAKKELASRFPYKIELLATTTLQDRELRIYAECDALDTAYFAENMYKSLLSVKFLPRTK